MKSLSSIGLYSYVRCSSTSFSCSFDKLQYIHITLAQNWTQHSRCQSLRLSRGKDQLYQPAVVALLGIVQKYKSTFLASGQLVLINKLSLMLLSNGFIIRLCWYMGLFLSRGWKWYFPLLTFPSSRLSGVRQLTPHLKTSSSRKDWRVIVLGNSLPRGTESPECQPDPTHFVVCSFPWDILGIRDISRKISSLIWPSDHYPLLIAQASSNEIAEGSLKIINFKKTFIVFRVVWSELQLTHN